MKRFLKTNKKLLVGVAGLACFCATPSFAAPVLTGAFTVGVIEASGAGPFSATTAGYTALNAQADKSTATFTYTGGLNFVSNAPPTSSNTGDLSSAFFGSNASGISGYSGTGPSTVVYGASGANYQTQSGFLATSGSAANYAWGSLYSFTSATGNYGGLNLTLTHDDGASVYANGVLLGGTTTGPTGVVTESVILPTATTQYTIVYARENGSPSILSVTAVPEPATWGMMILGFGAMGYALRRRKAAVAFA